MATTGNTFDCLREASTAEILTGLKKSIAEAQEVFGFDPTIDGPHGLLPDIPSNLLKAGRFAKLPFISGTNLDEGSYTVKHKSVISFLTISPFREFRNYLHFPHLPDNGRH